MSKPIVTKIMSKTMVTKTIGKTMVKKIMRKPKVTKTMGKPRLQKTITKTLNICIESYMRHLFHASFFFKIHFHNENFVSKLPWEPCKNVQVISKIETIGY